MTYQNTRKDNNKKKKSVIVISLLLAFVLAVGSIFAFFSDVIDIKTVATAGTLELEGGAKYYINVDFEAIDETTPEASEAELACLNPGDILTVIIDVENVGSKSAWYLSEFTLRATDASNNVVPANVLELAFTVEDEAEVLVGSIDMINEYIVYSDTAIVLDGTYEIETHVNAIEDTAISKVFFITFEKSAGNEFQGIKLTLDYVGKAIQFRNNTVPKWSEAVPLNPTP
ncbi:MAG: CalY family protein [Oscillospiraceae bacterium]|nr:CalY family protein [Oscillospiraceae bacterium]